ncbi:S-adenosyl-L-methionine-dependent methyltransferase [Paraphysoderma sedebokerense]|nr:S-adenosyl-L-methionine-dependent methyltransferase [Paraphysoderma sedebokerense]
MHRLPRPRTAPANLLDAFFPLSRSHCRLTSNATTNKRVYSSISSSQSPPISTTNVQKQPETPLVKHMKDLIKFQGPITVDTYIRQCLTNPLGGYYMKQKVFGKEGDFVTSPEISQMFGEMVAVWFMSQWLALGSPSHVQLIELGPGRGTLLSDMLRALSSFPSLSSKLDKIHLVEASPLLRQVQMDTLSASLRNGSLLSNVERDKYGQVLNARIGDTTVHWYESLNDVPEEAWTILIAHEFFDALPVYKFKLLPTGFHDILVSTLSPNSPSPYHFHYVLSPNPSTLSKLIVESNDYYASMVKSLKENDTIEVCPQAGEVMAKICKRVQNVGGNALIIDYGNENISKGSLRAIKNHQFVDIFDSPGECDLSTDVNFGFLRHIANNNGWFALNHSSLYSVLLT